ncbi:MAG: tetratricopeptide repeat protein, partial [Desulfobacteraceae bacterium]
MQIKQFYPYSPRKADFKQLSRSFVARESLLEELIDSIREQAAAEAIQHWMILGMRGMGKSHLIALLFQMIKNTADLNKDWIPLLMHEEEQSVFSLHTLFIRFLTQLGEEIVDTDKNKSRAISDFIDLQRDDNKKQEEILESVVAFLKDFVRETGKRLLVLMENSDDIFSRYISKKNDIKQFRNMLQHDNFMMLIATSPTFFDEISKPSAPLYQFFRIRNLELLTYEQAFELLNRWKQSDKQLSGRKSKTMQFDINDYRLRALYHLTGGNPRVLLFLYMTITGEDGIRSAVEIFSKLLEEDLSTYYLSRLRDLSNQVQPIILALAESDKNLTQKEIAQKTFLPMKSIGTAMLRLEKDRLIRPVTEKKGKNTLYTLTDNLFRLWHQWRISVHNKEVIRAVVMCVAVWYKKEELEQWSMSNDIIGIHCKEALQYRATEHFKSLWAPFHQESESMIIRYLKNEDDQNLSRILATLKETGIDAERILGKVGKDLEATGDVDKAVKVAKIRLENNNEDVDAWMDLARLYFRQENFEEGVSALEKIVEFSPENVKAWRGLGFVCNMQGNHVRAEAVLKKSIELDPKDARAWKHLGVSFNNQKRFGEAQKALEKALELDPKDVDAWIWLSRACGGQEDYTGAEVASQKAVELDPEDADGWRWLARACSSQGNDKGAEEAFKRIVELDPEDVDGWKWLGISLHALKRYGEAQAALEKSVELDPEDTDCWKWLARTCGSQGNYKGAEAALRKAVEIEPKDADAWKWLGRAYG